MKKVRTAQGEKIIVEKAGLSDLPAILEIEAESFPTPWSDEMFAAELGHERGVFLLAREGGALLGYVCAWVVLDEAHLMKLAVSPRRRREGIGTSLMETITREFKRRGVKEVWLEVRESNRPARLFYQKLGFREFGRRKKYYADTGEDAVVMHKEILDS